MRRFALPLVFATLSLAASGASAEVVIDDFESGSISLSAGGGTSDSVFEALGSVFGGARNAFVQGFGEPPATVTLAPGAGDDAVAVLSGGGANATFSYGDGVPHVDLSAEAQLEVDLVEAPSAGTLTLSLSTDITVTNGAMNASVPIDGPGLYVVPFASFTETGPGGPVDLSRTDRVGLSIFAAAVSRETYRIADVRAVPEPGADGLRGAALLAVAALARAGYAPATRRRQSSS